MTASTERTTLLSHHREHLHASGLTDKTIDANGISSMTEARLIEQMLGRKWGRKGGPILRFPYHDELGEVSFSRARPDNPPAFQGKPSKYLQPKGIPPRVYFPHGTRELLANPEQPTLITEGEKKALCAHQNGFPCVSLPGVDCWHPKKSSRLVPDLERIEWKCRRVYIVFDSDAATNGHVLFLFPELGQQSFGQFRLVARRGVDLVWLRVDPVGRATLTANSVAPQGCETFWAKKCAGLEKPPFCLG